MAGHPTQYILPYCADNAGSVSSQADGAADIQACPCRTRPSRQRPLWLPGYQHAAHTPGLARGPAPRPAAGAHLADVRGLDQVDVVVCLVALHDARQAQQRQRVCLAANGEAALTRLGRVCAHAASAIQNHQAACALLCAVACAMLLAHVHAAVQY